MPINRNQKITNKLNNTILFILIRGQYSFFIYVRSFPQFKILIWKKRKHLEEKKCYVFWAVSTSKHNKHAPASWMGELSSPESTSCRPQFCCCYKTRPVLSNGDSRPSILQMGQLSSKCGGKFFQTAWKSDTTST